MTLPAVVLLLIAAGTHAGWNFLGKREHPDSALMLLANTLGCLPLLLAVLFWGGVLRFYTPQVWGWLALTGFFQALYYAALAGAYRRGDLSVAYPLARSAPVVLVAVLSQALGQGQTLGGLALAGMGLVVAGCWLLPLRAWREFHWRSYWNWASLLALTAAVGTSGYSLVDDRALRVLRQATSGAFAPWTVTLVYAFWEGLASSAWLLGWVLLRRTERQALWSGLRVKLGRAALMGVAMCLAYCLVLVAMGLVSNVSYVVAFRQLSIPLGALLGLTLLHEPAHQPKLVGIGLVFIGLVLTAVG
jgi:drug/metabolite transporter (DMT)-like permease